MADSVVAEVEVVEEEDMGDGRGEVLLLFLLHSEAFGKDSRNVALRRDFGNCKATKMIASRLIMSKPDSWLFPKPCIAMGINDSCAF